MKPIIKVDIVSDIVCPWCYIGKRRVENAMAQLSTKFTFDVTYLPFELNPAMPEAGENQHDYLVEKFGSVDRYEQLTEQTTRIADLEGISFDYARQKISPNTRKAHSLLFGAKADGNQIEMAEALFKAYFTDGINLSETRNLISIATGMGMSTEVINQRLDAGALKSVELMETQLQRQGISSVPYYIVNDRYGISGAQKVETFMEAFEEIGREAALEEASQFKKMTS